MSVNWFNPDGLFVKFGTNEAAPTKVGEISTWGLLREVEVRMDLATATGTPGTVVIQDHNIRFPVGTVFQQVDLYTQIVATGATATLDVGLIRTDETTAINLTGLIAGETVANLGNLASIRIYEAAASTPAGVTGGGLITGATALVFPGLLTARANTAAFTAGLIRLRIKYFVPTTLT